MSEMVFVLGWVLCPWVCQSLHRSKAPVGTKPYPALSPPELPAALSPKNRQTPPPKEQQQPSSALGTAGGALTQPLAVLEGLVHGVAGGAIPMADPTAILHRVRVDLIVTAHVLQGSPTPSAPHCQPHTVSPTPSAPHRQPQAIISPTPPAPGHKPQAMISPTPSAVPRHQQPHTISSPTPAPPSHSQHRLHCSHSVPGSWDGSGWKGH